MNHEIFKKLANEKGLCLIRLFSRSKIPAESWRDKHRRTYEEIGFLEGENAGITTGRKSGVIVLDIDDQEKFSRQGYELPETFSVETGKGSHHYFKYPKNGKEYRNRSIQRMGLDIRADGGYVVSPGSIHPNGTQYTIIKDIPFAEAPDWLLELSLQKRKTEASAKEALQPLDFEPIELQDIRAAQPIIDLILTGTQAGQRSEAIWKVLNALVESGLSDEQVLYIFEEYPIGQKYLEKGEHREEWLLNQIKKIREEDGSQNQYHVVSLPDVVESGKPGIDHEKLTDLALKKVIELLVKYENNPTQKHKNTLRQIVETYSLMIQGRLKERIAFPLGTGLGKTTSIVAFISAAFELGYTDFSMTVAASKVEQLADLKRDLVADGVPEEEIGLIHSYKYDRHKAQVYLEGSEELPDNYASEPCTNHDEVEDKQFLLVTHNRIQGRAAIGEYMTYRGKERDLLIWDESMIGSHSKGLSLVQIKSAIGALKPFVEEFPWNALEQTLLYCETALAAIENAVKEYSERGKKKTLKLPELNNYLRAEYHNALLKVPLESQKVLKELLDISQYELAVCDSQRNGLCVVHYKVTVPRELKSIVILDASAPIRELMKLDKSIRLLEGFEGNSIVSYRNVMFHRIPHYSGRTSISKSFGSKKKALAKEIVSIISGIPEHEAILLFTFKHKKREPNCREILEKELREAGIDPEAQVNHNGLLKPRFNWLTHGNESAYNKFSYCSNTIFVGLLHLDYMTIVGQIIGQSDDLLREVSGEDLKLVDNSEMAYRLQQGSCRSQCRIVVNGVALPTKVWFTHPDDSLKTFIQQVMPDAQWKEYKPKYIESARIIDKLVHHVKEVLSGLTVDRISTSRLKGMLSIKYSNTTFTDAMEIISMKPDVDWIKDKRSLVRVTAETYGFQIKAENAL